MECKVIQTLDLGTHEIFIGDIVETYCSEECLTPGKRGSHPGGPDSFSMSGARYFRLGEQFALAWDAGKELNAKDVTMNTPPPVAKD